VTDSDGPCRWEGQQANRKKSRSSSVTSTMRARSRAVGKRSGKDLHLCRRASPPRCNRMNVLQKSACFYFSWNDNPEYTKTYIETYAKLNPAIVPAMIQTPVDRCRHSWISSRSNNIAQRGSTRSGPPRRAISTQSRRCSTNPPSVSLLPP